MKLTAFILLVFGLHLSAKTASQTVTLSGNHLKLENVLAAIKEQTGFISLYDKDALRDAGPISITADKKPLKHFLQELFKSLPLNYTIKNTSIIISRKIVPDNEKPRDMMNYILPITGVVKDANGKPLVGATVRVKRGIVATVTDEEGGFSLVADEGDILIVSYIGFESREIKVAAGSLMNISLVRLESLLDTNMVVVNTGYQNLPKERSIGSFEIIDNELFNRSTGTNVTSRLLGTVAGVYFNNRSALSPRGDLGDNISIRGISSFANIAYIKPLVVLDNIPYEGDLANLNPNDVENITILKDAAAASIWGTRAGNGVIVITTKKGAYNKPLDISLNSNVTISQKPDLFYLPQMSSSDMIDVEKVLFANKFYDGRLAITSPYPVFFTPVVELLAKQRNLSLTDVQGRAQIDEQINALRQYDVRNDYLKYTYRNAVNQQHAINISGGSKQVSYMLSVGYDKNLNNLVTSNYNRTSLRSNVSLKPSKQLDIQTGLLYTKSKISDLVDVSSISYAPGQYYPYARLADDNGNPLAPGGTFRVSYLDNLANNPNLLDWRNKPLEDMNKTAYTGYQQDILFNLGITYTFNSIFSANVKYQYENTNSNSKAIYNQDSYYVRNLVNNYTDPTTFNRVVPLGAINTPTQSLFNAQTIRGQINANKSWNKHQLTAIVGSEARKNYGLTSILNTLYGFKPNTNAFQTVNTKDQFPQYYGGTNFIPNQPSIDDNNNRFTSLFANAAYTYNNLYSVYASIRKDASNVFGDNANKQGTPLWSTGASWDLSKENFYKFDLLPKLKLRATYGYSGNVVGNVPAYAVVTYPGNDATTGLPYAQTTSSPNPGLRWETVGIINIGVDFVSKNNRLTGSLEYFDKRASDLVVNTPIDLTTGARTQALNSANLHGKGVEITLNSINVTTPDFHWNSTFIFNYNRNITTRYLSKQTAINNILQSNSINPIEGKDAYAVVAYQWAGLDPLTGDPQGYLNGQVSKDYSNLLKPKVDDLKYFGSSVPVFYGAFRNTFSFKRIELSANILYKFDYYFRRAGIDYGTLYNTSTGNAEFAQRWQKPGDEKHTDVPSMIYPNNSNRDAFYNRSAAVVEKGGHIRLQDITLAYVLPRTIPGIRSVRLYANINNVGIIWRANHKRIDPDILSGYPVPRTISMGLNANF